MDGGTKATLAFQFLVLAVQDTCSQMSWVLWGSFFLQLISRVFLCDLFSLSVLFAKQVCIPRGKAPSGAVDVKFIIMIWPCCSAAPVRCLTAEADCDSYEGWESILVVPRRLLLTRGDRKYKHPRGRTCISTSDGIQVVWFGFDMEPYFVFLSNLRSECDF